MERESERRELWHQLDNESDRAHDAFKCYMLLPPAERSVRAAWREWTGNPDAKREPPYFAGWAKDYGWSDRARARDHHLEVIRERGMEATIEQEAAEQARQAERMRGRFNELMTVTYERAIDYLESEVFVQQMRPQDVINILKVHLEAVERQGGFDPPQQEAEWTEDELAEIDRIVAEIDAEEAQEEPEEGSNADECSTDGDEAEG
jgi:hypothetical protein